MKEKEWINKKFQERLNIYKLLQLKGLKDSSLQGTDQIKTLKNPRFQMQLKIQTEKKNTAELY
jgi:hypothetical protein